MSDHCAWMPEQMDGWNDGLMAAWMCCVHRKKRLQCMQCMLCMSEWMDGGIPTTRVCPQAMHCVSARSARQFVAMHCKVASSRLGKGNLVVVHYNCTTTAR